MKSSIKIRHAKLSDIKKIHALINHFANQDEMLPRSLGELYDTIRNFFIAEDEGAVIGCAALEISWESLAEVKSVAIASDYQGKGVGTLLVNECLNDAKKWEIEEVFTLTYKPDFFKRFGFRVIENSELPHKVWSECIRCPKFPDCNEIAMKLRINGNSGGTSEKN